MKASTTNVSFPGVSLRLGLLLVSAAGISYQLMMMQFFSYVQWSHFASMIISVALLGFGTAGTLLTIYEHKFLGSFDQWFPRLMFLSAFTMSLALPLVNLNFVRFDSFLLFGGQGQWVRLLATYVILFIPFFFAALAIGSTFIKFPLQIGVLYFYDLVGAGLGGLLALLLMWWLLPWQQHAFIAILPFLGGLLCIPKGKMKLDRFLWWITGAAIVVQFFWAPDISGSQFKDLSKSLLLPEAKKEFTAPSPYGVLEVVSSPVLRYAPGLSLTFGDEVPIRSAVFQNGNWIGPIMPKRDVDTPAYEFSVDALAFRLAAKQRMLILDASTGEYIAQGLWHEFDNIVALESNAEIARLMQGKYLESSDSLWSQPSVQIAVIEARTFLMTVAEKYDLMIFPRLGSFGGMGGIEALQENYLMTKESIAQVFEHLSDDGLASVTCWMDSPLRVPLRLLATVVAALEDAGIEEASKHLIVVKSWGTMTFILSKSPFSEQAFAQASHFCSRLQFDALLLGSELLDTADQLHQQGGSLLMGAFDELLFQDRQTFFREYDFAVQPVTDQKPYFFQFIKMDRVGKLRHQLGASHLFLELGYAVIWMAFLLILVVALAFIFLPLFRVDFSPDFRSYTFLYFAGIGIGYLFLEIILIQQFVLFLGHPIFAATGVISILLITSGLGSWFSSRMPVDRKKIRQTAALIVAMIMIYAVFLTPILQATVGTTMFVKVLIMLLLIGSLGFLMGMMFPFGIRWLATHRTQGMIPWAWGINSYFSVISALLATILAVEIGFTWIFILAGLAYGLPLIVNLNIGRKG